MQFKNRFILKLSNLPKSFGLELYFPELYIQGGKININSIEQNGKVTRLFFNFNINDYILKENREYYCMS